MAGKDLYTQYLDPCHDQKRQRFEVVIGCEISVFPVITSWRKLGPLEGRDGDEMVLDLWSFLPDHSIRH